MKIPTINQAQEVLSSLLYNDTAIQGHKVSIIHEALTEAYKSGGMDTLKECPRKAINEGFEVMRHKHSIEVKAGESSVHIPVKEEVSFNIGIGELTLTKNEVRDIWGENKMMKDAILFLIDPETGKASFDNVFGSIEQVKEQCRGLYGKSWNQEFIDKVFKK